MNHCQQLTTKQAFWFGHVAAWQQSGISANEYSRQNNFKSRTFYDWIYRYQKAGRHERENHLVEISVPVPLSDSPFEIILPNELRIKVPGNYPDAALLRLLKTLGVQL